MPTNQNNSTPDFGSFMLAISDVIQTYYGTGPAVLTKTKATVAEVAEAATPTPAKKAVAKKADAAPAAAPAKRGSRAATAAAAKTEDDPWEARKAELTGKSMRQLHRIAKALGFEQKDLDDMGSDDDAKSEVVDMIVETEQEDAAAADTGTDTDDDADDDDDDAVSKDELLALTLTELKALAREAGHKTAELKGLDKDALIELLSDEGDDDEDDDEDDEDDDDKDGLTVADLEDMSLAELKALVRDNGMSVKRGSTSEDLIDLLVEKGVATDD